MDPPGSAYRAAEGRYLGGGAPPHEARAKVVVNRGKKGDQQQFAGRLFVLTGNSERCYAASRRIVVSASGDGKAGLLLHIAVALSHGSPIITITQNIAAAADGTAGYRANRAACSIAIVSFGRRCQSIEKRDSNPDVIDVVTG